jgi:NDP-sugar pyrophosphorylase family protein
MVEQYVKSQRWGALEVSFSADSEPGSGTAVAVIDSSPPDSKECFVTYGDSLTDVNLDIMCKIYGDSNTSVITHQEISTSQVSGNVIPNEASNKVLYLSKNSRTATSIEHGIMILNMVEVRTEVARRSQLKPSLPAVLETLSRNGRLAGIQSSRGFLEIGTPESLERARLSFPDYYGNYEF